MRQIIEENRKSRKSELRKIRRNNATLYPIYKMFSWDLLFFYSIEFLFLTITKRVTTSQILIINGCYLLLRILCQLPAVLITDSIGKRNSIILGNILLICFVLLLIFVPGVIGILVADLFFSLGYDMKTIAESNLLYDSVATRGGEGLYSKLDTKGGSWYYMLDGIASLSAGYLFVVNNYLPLIICLCFLIISTILSFRFKEVFKSKDNNKPVKDRIKGTINGLEKCFKFIFKSKRMKAFILFQIVFYSFIKITDTFRGQLLTDLNVPEEQFSMIFGAFTLIGGISLSLKKNIEKRFKNRTLTFISLMHIGSCIMVGIISNVTTSQIIIPIILIMYSIMKISTSIWWVLETKYLKNFTTESMRNQLTFAYEIIGGIAASICSIISGLLLKVINVEYAFLLFGLFYFACMILVLDYMRKRFGLRPKEYRKEDIEF